MLPVDTSIKFSCFLASVNGNCKGSRPGYEGNHRGKPNFIIGVYHCCLFGVPNLWQLVVFYVKEGDKEIATKMQELALSEGALPRHLHTSLFTISSDQRMLTNRSTTIQFSPDSFFVFLRQVSVAAAQKWNGWRISGFSFFVCFFSIQAAQSTPRRPVDGREPCCNKPTQEDTGEAPAQMNLKHMLLSPSVLAHLSFCLRTL